MAGSHGHYTPRCRDAIGSRWAAFLILIFIPIDANMVTEVPFRFGPSNRREAGRLPERTNYVGGDMSTIEEIKSAVAAEIDRRGDELIDVAKTILVNPEPGFREEKTSRLVAEKFRDFGIPFEDGIALTGLKGMLDSGNDGPTVGVFGELDSLMVKGHVYEDPVTSAAHACGHHCQVSMMLAVGIGLNAAVPCPSWQGGWRYSRASEEYVKYYRDQLRGGKWVSWQTGVCASAPWMSTGDDDPYPVKLTAVIRRHNNGIVAENIRFVGKASHAGGAYGGIHASTRP